MADQPVVIYHNARCSKSRATCQLIAERGVPATVINYLETPPSREVLRALLAKLGMAAADLVRRSEPAYQDLYAGRTLSEDEWIAALATHPILIERPIVVCGQRAVIGRPPEKALELLDTE